MTNTVIFNKIHLTTKTISTFDANQRKTNKTVIILTYDELHDYETKKYLVASTDLYHECFDICLNTKT